MPSFDIVSRLDLAEVDNALAGLTREIGTRFDFKGTQMHDHAAGRQSVMLADDELKLKTDARAAQGAPDAAQGRCRRARVQAAEKASGNMLRQTVVLKQGIDRELAKRIVREIKDSRLKVQASDPGRGAARHRQEARRSAGGDHRAARPQDRAAAAICEFPRLSGGAGGAPVEMRCRDRSRAC